MCSDKTPTQEMHCSPAPTGIVQLGDTLRIYFIDGQGALIGTKTPRTPRKVKKRLKAIGGYLPPHFAGFPVSLLDHGPKATAFQLNLRP